MIWYKLLTWKIYIYIYFHILLFLLDPSGAALNDSLCKKNHSRGQENWTLRPLFRTSFLFFFVWCLQKIKADILKFQNDSTALWCLYNGSACTRKRRNHNLQLLFEQLRVINIPLWYFQYNPAFFVEFCGNFEGICLSEIQPWCWRLWENYCLVCLVVGVWFW